MSAITFLTGITVLTPIKLAWLAITALNVVMMLYLAWGSWVGALSRSFSGAYFMTMATVSLVQGASSWNRSGEIWLAVCTSFWVFSMLPKDKPGRIFALSVGLVVTCVLIYAVPPPWPHYPPAMYFTRLYSTAAFLGIALASALSTRKPSTMLAVPWFMAVLIAGSQRGWDRWMVGIYSNAMWTACLICWLALARRDGYLAASSGPDVPGDHRQSSQSLPWMGISSLPTQRRGIRR